MGPVEIGALSIVLVVALIYAGLYVPIALGLVSVLGVWLIRDRLDLAINLLTVAVGDSVADYNFATIPLFMMMGLIVSRVGIGRDVYDVANDSFRRVKGGLGIATVPRTRCSPRSPAPRSLPRRSSRGCRCPRCGGSPTASASAWASSRAAPCSGCSSRRA